jgi:sec-independent protein translocase protein TatB
MLGLGWTEMLVIGVVALIFIGPKDLPVVMGRIGKVIGQVQRMGREFQREINKTTGLDEVRNLRTSITSPIKKTAEEIRKDFNAIGKDGKEQPTGALKPTDPNTESVVEAIQQQAGMAPVQKSNDELASDYGFKASKPATAEPVKAPRAPAKPAAKTPAAAKTATVEAKPAPAKPKAAAKPKAPAKAATPVSRAEAAPAPAAKAPRKPATPKAVEPVAQTESKPDAKTRAPRKKTAEAAGKSE